MSRITRFGAGAIADLAEVCAEVGVARPLLVTTRRGAASAADLPVISVYDGVRRHVPAETVDEVVALARGVEADGLVALGGGSAVDTAKAAAAKSADSSLPLSVVAVPTTYAGAEWTPYFGVLVAPGRKGGGADERARPVAAIYDPLLTLGLSIPDSVGTAMNALAHCAEAYYVAGRTDRAVRHADTGARAIAHALPLVAADPEAVDARTRLLEGAMHAALALAESGLALAHAMAQALGGRYGLSHGAMNAICLPAALRFNAEAVPESVQRFARALGAADAASRCEELAALGWFRRLRDQGVPEDELSEVAAAVVARPGARANPRAVTTSDVETLLRSVW